MTAQVSQLRPAQAPSKRSWLSPAQVCEQVPGVTERILEDLRGRGRGPRYFKPTPKTVIYEQSDIDTWVKDSEVSTRDSH